MSKGRREFWIDDLTERVCARWDHPELGVHKMPWPDNEKVIHVVEMSAVQPLLDALEWYEAKGMATKTSMDALAKWRGEK